MNKKGSLFHISKRDALPLPKALLIRGGILLLALVFCGLITTLLTGENPINVYGTILKGAFGTARKSWTTWENVAILLGISLAVTPAFKMRFWNIGAEGQVLAGGLAAAACMICLGDKVPNGLLIVLIVIAGIAAGAVMAMLCFDRLRWPWNLTEKAKAPYREFLAAHTGLVLQRLLKAQDTASIKDLLALDVLDAAAFAEGAALAAKADNAAAAALLADAEHKKRGSAPKKRRYDFDF